MANSFVTYTGDAVTTDYSIPFPYISSTDLVVELDGVASSAYTLLNASTLRFNSAPAAAVNIRISRDSVAGGRKVDYQRGSLTEADLDTDSLQGFYAAQEAADIVELTIAEDVSDGKWDAQTNIIKNVVDPVDDQDAATKKYIDDRVANAEDVANLNNLADLFLGSKTANPTVDNQGDPLVEGATYFNSVVKTFMVYTGGIWTNSARIDRFDFTMSGGETSVSGADDNAQTLVYTPGRIQVYLNGILLVPDTDYTASDGSSITALDPVSSSDVVSVMSFTDFNTVSTYTEAEVDALLAAKAPVANPVFTGVITGDGSGLTNLPVDTADIEARLALLEQNLALNTLRDVIDSGWSILSMIDGFADEFNDETGVSVSSSGQFYDSDEDSYASVNFSDVPATGGTALGNFSGLTSNAFDGVENHTTSTGAYTTGSPEPGLIGYDFGSNVSLARIVVISSSNQGFHYSSGGTSSITMKVQYSDDNSVWTDIGDPQTFNNANSTLTRTFNFTQESHRYWRVHMSDSVGQNWTLSEVNFYSRNVIDMTLISESQTANAQPSNARGVFLMDVDATATLNTDVIAEISRDGGTTWTASTLTEEADYSGNVKVYSTNDVDISAQPAGTSVSIRVRSLNTKEVTVHAWTAQWR